MSDNNSACLYPANMNQSNLWYSETQKKVALMLSTLAALLAGTTTLLVSHFGEGELKKQGLPEVKSVRTDVESRSLRTLISATETTNINLRNASLNGSIKRYNWDTDPHLEKLVEKKIRLWQLSASPRSSRRPLDTISKWISNVSVYRDYISDAAAKYSIDENFLTALFAWESRGNPRAKSIKAARGFGQFMRITASEKGLVINDAIDERLDPSKAIYAAASYIRDAAKIYDEYSFLITAYYNYGPGNLRRKIKRYGLTGSLYYKLPRETQQHYASIFAIKKLLDNPEAYNFSYDLKPSFKAVLKNARHYTIKKGENLGSIAERYNTDLDVILFKNPRILDHKRLKHGTVIKI